MSLRTQAQVDAKGGAFISGTRQHLRRQLRKPDEVFAIRDLSVGRRFSFAEHVKQVHIRAVVELVAAQLPHRKDGERNRREAAALIRALRSAISLLLDGYCFSEGLLDQHIAQRGDLGGGLS